MARPERGAEAAEGHEGPGRAVLKEAGGPAGREGLASYRCEDCELSFWVPADAPQHLEGFQELSGRDGLPDYGLSCPWCMGWCYPQQPALRRGAGRHHDDDPTVQPPARPARPDVPGGEDEDDGDGGEG